MIALQDYLRQSADVRHLVTLLAFWGAPASASTLVQFLRPTCAQPKPGEFVRRTLQVLVQRKWVGRLSGSDQRYVFQGALAREAYVEMVREADGCQWWPSLEQAGETLGRDFFPELHRAKDNVFSKAPSFAMLVSEGLRLFAVGSGAGATAEFRSALKGEKRVTLLRGVAGLAAQRFGEEPAFALTADDPLLAILPAWFAHAFLLGRRVTGALAEMHRLIADAPDWKQSLREAYWTLGAWTGHADWIRTSSLDADLRIRRGLLFVLAGDLKRADAEFKNWQESGPQDNEKDSDATNLHVRALLAIVSAFVHPDKLAKKRPGDLLFGNRNPWYVYDGSEQWADAEYRNHMARIGEWAALNWNDGTAGRTGILAYLRQRETVGPVTGLVGAVCYHQLAVGRAAWRDVAEKLWRYAKEADANGWSFIAQLFSALLAGGYDAAADAAYLQDLDARSLAILPRVAPEPEWKGLLGELEKVVTRTEKARTKRASGTEPEQRLVWFVGLEKNPDGETYDLVQLAGGLHYVAFDDDCSEDHELQYGEFEKKAVKTLMSEKDSLIFAARYARSSYYYEATSTDIVERLCGAPNLIHRKLGRRDAWSISWGRWGAAMTLTAETCTMTTTVSETGGLILAAPEWAVRSDRDWFIRKVEGEHFALVRISSEAKKVLALFRKYGTDGKITIPREGVTRAEPVVASLATLLPIAESTAGTEDLKRVNAATDIRLRLDFENGVFSVRGVVLPVPENPNLALDPGLGPTEKLVAGSVASYVLVRDLAAETAAFAPVRNALADCECAFDGKSFWRFDDLAEGIAALTKLKALTPPVPLEWFASRRLSVTQAPASGVKLTSSRTADDWFRVDGAFELDDGRVLSIVELLEASKGRSGRYVRLSDGDYLALTDTLARELDALNAAGRRKGDGVEIVKAAIPMLDKAFDETDGGVKLPDALAATADEIRAAFAKRPKVPAALNAELRPYQEDGYRWLSRLAACGFGSCLADDMGLGKTVQVIALLLERAANGASLVIAPSSVCGNWRRELERFAPTLTPVMALEEGVDISAAKARAVVIASYGYLLFHADEFASVAWNGLVLDEAQAIKNDASKRAKAVKRLHAKFRVVATGTPVENRLSELWSLFDFLNPGLLGPAASFAQRFTVDGKAVPELKRLVKPLILRRLKGDVLDDLPEKTEVTIPVVLGKAEREAYEGCRLHALQQLASKGESEGGANRMSILAELTRLRRFCCHPSLVLPGSEIPSAKMEALVELLEGLHEGHHRALVFSQFTDYLALVRKVIAAHGWTHLYLDGTTPTLERERLVNAFQGGEGDFFAISLKAGGTGLNLTAANYVILLDPWWNPAVENQAADRAHRIGQKNPVTVYRLIASDTVEARVIELHREKQAIAEDVLEGTSSSALTPAQLMKLFA